MRRAAAAPAQVASGGLSFEAKRCSAVRRPVSFSRRGLVGGRASQLGDELNCRVSRKQLVRVRAVFRGPADLVLSKPGTFYSAEGRMESGRLDGTPLVYADVADSGAARLFAARGCS